MGSERECILDVGDPATGRENTELVFMTGRTTRGGEEVEEPGRGGIGGGSSCGRWETGEAYDEAEGGGPRAKEGP